MKSSWTFVQYNVSNSIIFAVWGASCRKFAYEAKQEIVGHAVKYIISKNIMKTIFWINCAALVKGFYGIITFIHM